MTITYENYGTYVDYHNYEYYEYYEGNYMTKITFLFVMKTDYIICLSIRGAVEDDDYDG